MRVIPMLRSRTITRTRLLESLQHWPELRLIQIVAPAGYGKSTCAAAWAHSFAALPDARRPTFVWLSLFEDIDADRWLRALIEALLPAVPTLQSLLPLDGSGQYSPAQRLRMLVAELAAAPRPLILVIDDYHLLSDPALHALTQQLLNSAPPGVLIVLVSRTTPPLDITPLILDDAVLTLTERDLAFDHDEFLAFVRLSGLDSQPVTILDDLERRCIGWVSALKLLAYDLQHGLPGRAAAVLTHPSDASLHQFIESRILSTLPEPLREFALRAAPLPWISAGLMAAVADISPDEAARRITALVDSNAFLTEFPAPDDQPRVRFHPLFQDALLHAAAKRAEQPVERRRAAAWFLSRDDADAALNLLAPDLDPADFADDIAHTIRRAIIRSDLAAAQRWLVALPPALLAAHASLAVAAAWTAFLSESISSFEPAIPRAQTALASCTGADELQLDVMVQSVYLHVLHGRMDVAAHELAAAETFARPADTLGYGYLQLMHVLLPSDPSDFEARAVRLQAAAEIFERIGHDHGVVTMFYSRMLLKFRFADLPGALASATFLQGFVERRHLDRAIYAQENQWMRGQILYLLNRIPEARDIFRHILDTPAYDNQLGYMPYIASLYLQLCDAAEAVDPSATLHQTDEVADAAQWAHVLELDFNSAISGIAWPRILRDHRAGRPERCQQTPEAVGKAPANLTDHVNDHIQLMFFASAILSSHGAPQLSVQLGTFLEHLDGRHAVFMAMQTRLLHALHALQNNDQRTALSLLRELLPGIERSGAARLLLDFPILQPLLHNCSGPFARRLLALFRATPTLPIFTDQETRILVQLAAGLTTKDIAAVHTLSINTVYSHVNRIFRKLGVHDRADAIRAAREAGVM